MADERKEPGDALAWSAADWNAWAAAAASAGGAAAGHGMGGPIGSSGGVLRDHTPRSAWARLAGTGSPYDWQEVVRDVAGGSWADGPGSGTASAIEINGAAGLAGTIQRITECGPGEWCFQAVRIGVASYPTPTPCEGCDVPRTLFLTWGDYSITDTLTYSPGEFYWKSVGGGSTFHNTADGYWKGACWPHPFVAGKYLQFTMWCARAGFFRMNCTAVAVSYPDAAACAAAGTSLTTPFIYDANPAATQQCTPLLIQHGTNYTVSE